MFQPKPTVLVVIAKLGGGEPNTNLIEELMGRTPKSAQSPDGMWSLLQEVSGYDTLSGRIPKQGEEFVNITAKPRIDGNAPTDTHRETYTCFEYASEAEAKKAECGFKQIDA